MATNSCALDSVAPDGRTVTLVKAVLMGSGFCCLFLAGFARGKSGRLGGVSGTFWLRAISAHPFTALMRPVSIAFTKAA